MKKLFYLLFLLPLAFFASCSSDDDLPEVDLKVSLSGVTKKADSNVFYTVSDQTVAVTEFSATSLTGKAATVANSTYYINAVLPGLELNPLNPTFSAEVLQPNATNYLLISSQVLQVDKSLANCSLSIPIVCVPTVEDLPADLPELGEYDVTFRVQPK